MIIKVSKKIMLNLAADNTNGGIRCELNVAQPIY